MHNLQENGYEKLRLIGLTAVFILISLMINGVANAAAYSGDDSQSRLEDILKTIDKGWQLKSNGGLLYVHPDDKRYWVSLSGVLRFDQTYFSGSHRDKAGIPNANSVGFPSGGNLRLAEVDITGGIGPDWNYNLGLTFGGINTHNKNGTQFAFSDSWLAYSGFCDNIELFVGRHSGNWFGLENSTSSSWYPFLERSVQANAFYPGDGLGLLVDAWWDDGGFTALALQPDHGPRPATGPLFSSDRWLGMTTLTFAPIHESGDVWHFGVSLMCRKSHASVNNALVQDFSYASRPSARARNIANSVSTGDLALKRSQQVNVEIARQYGPLLLQAEYTQAYINVFGNQQRSGHFNFNGGSVIGQYMLTGEVHNYDIRDGNFGGIQVCSPYGAFEVAARYDFISLNDKTIQGGTQHDATVGLNWYVNDNIRVAFNYVNANFRPSQNNAIKRHLDIFAARLQVKFK